MVPVRPVIHYAMGGVHTNNDGATPLAGLFAAGEVACVSINGANRLGSNSLPELLVFGARAGQAAASLASDQKKPSSHVLAQANDERRRLEEQYLRKTGGSERIATIREEMQATMEEGAGIYRNGEALEKSADTIRELQDRFRNVLIEDDSRTFNTELTSALELAYMLDVAASIVQCGLKRTESRGAHQRTDFPSRDDNKFLAHSLIYRNEDGSSRIEYLPVTITRWPPADRVYGK
jgi:fumarate reductase flavoprotein subunit